MGRFYSETDTGELRRAFEGRVLRWPEVRAKTMFGCPAYRATDELFAFLVTEGVVITRLESGEREALSRRFRATPFRAGSRTVHDWIRVPLRGKDDLEGVLPLVRRSYEASRGRTRK